MTDHQLPDPLVPADVDLRGLEYMPLLGHHLFGSDFNSQCSDSEWRAGLTLWWAAWNQVPAASLPNDDAALARLADMGRDVKGWRKIKAKALHGFVLCSDGRLYHKFLAPQALVAWEKRVEATNKAKAEAERKRKERARRAHMFEQLHEVGIAPEWNATTSELERLVAQHVTHLSRGQRPPVTPDNPHLSRGQQANVTPPVTPPVTAKTGRDVTGRDGTTTNPSGSAKSPHVELSIALRAAGVKNATPQNPDVLRWAAEGVTLDEVREGARIAIEERGKPQPSTRYLVGIIADLRNPPERPQAGPSNTARAIAALEDFKETGA